MASGTVGCTGSLLTGMVLLLLYFVAGAQWLTCTPSLAHTSLHASHIPCNPYEHLLDYIADMTTLYAEGYQPSESQKTEQQGNIQTRCSAHLHVTCAMRVQDNGMCRHASALALGSPYRDLRRAQPHLQILWELFKAAVSLQGTPKVMSHEKYKLHLFFAQVAQKSWFVNTLHVASGDTCARISSVVPTSSSSFSSSATLRPCPPPPAMPTPVRAT